MTDPSHIPPDVAAKILAARDALLGGSEGIMDVNEAWHQLYSIADPSFSSYTPWEVLERVAQQHQPQSPSVSP